MDLSKHLGHGTSSLIKQSNQFDFEQNIDEPCVYKTHQDKVVIFLVLYVDDILLIGNAIQVMSLVKIWLSSQFDMKDLGEASYILGIKLW